MTQAVYRFRLFFAVWILLAGVLGYMAERDAAGGFLPHHGRGTEESRGAEPLYWEDVDIGDETAWTLEGPIFEGKTPSAPWGMVAPSKRKF